MTDRAARRSSRSRPEDPQVDEIRRIQQQFADSREVEYVTASAAILWSYKVMTQRVETALVPLDLNMPRYEVLARLVTTSDGRMTVRDLKRATLLTSPTMTYTITALEERGLIARHHDEVDRRTVTVEILPPGRALASRALDALTSIHFGLSGLTRPTAHQVAVLLSDLHPHLSPVADRTADGSGFDGEER